MLQVSNSQMPDTGDGSGRAVAGSSTTSRGRPASPRVALRSLADRAIASLAGLVMATLV